MEDDLEDSLGHKISILAVLLKRQVFRNFAENKLPITPDQWIIMHFLWEQNGLSISELALKTKKDFANVTRIVDKLSRQNYVERRKDQTDSRITKVYTLPAGDDLRIEIEQCWKRSNEILLYNISYAEQEMMLDGLRRMERNLAEHLKENSKGTAVEE